LNSQADFGITQLPVAEQKLQVVRIHSDDIRLLMPVKHRLAGKRAILPEDLIGEQLLIPKSGTTRSRLDQWLEMVEEKIQISMELDSTEMIKRFVLAGLGLSFLAESHSREEVKAGKLAAISLGPEPMVRRLGLIYRKDKALSKAALGFIQAILDRTAGHADHGASDERATTREAVLRG
jgi:DNA-binding transcriptional LysR family regulator